MARTVRDARLETRSARLKLVTRHEPYWKAIDSGMHLGYRKGKRKASWLARYRSEASGYMKTVLGIADDTQDADGVTVLNFSQAQEKAREWFSQKGREELGVIPAGPLTVAAAMKEYLDWYGMHRRSRNPQTLRDVHYRVNAFILPALGNVELAKLTTKRIRDWMNALATTPPRVRSRQKAISYRDTSNDPDTTRKRRASANRLLTILKAALNHAWHEGKVESDMAWRRVKPFPGVDVARVRYLSQAECVRLINSCESDFRRLVQAALYTGCRYGELTAMRVSDFNLDSGTILVREGKGGKSRNVVLTDKGQEFIEGVTAGREGNETLFSHADGRPWRKAHQHRPLREACQRANIKPPISFHILRHTYASHLVMSRVPLPVIGTNLGHADTRMLDKHYSHLAPSYVADTIRNLASNLNFGGKSNVAVLKPHER